MHPQVEERVHRASVSTEHRASIRDLRLEARQAARWLAYLERLSPQAQYAQTLAQFRDQLDDALWLARWKREDVMMDVELTAVPDLLAAISSEEPALSSDGSLDIQADILAALSKMSGWT